jgi:hypothetical protein
MIGDLPVDRVVIVHGEPDPMLTCILDLIGLGIVEEIGDVTVWAPRYPNLPMGCLIPDRPPDWPL